MGECVDSGKVEMMRSPKLALGTSGPRRGPGAIAGSIAVFMEQHHNQSANVIKKSAINANHEHWCIVLMHITAVLSKNRKDIPVYDIEKVRCPDDYVSAPEHHRDYPSLATQVHSSTSSGPAI
jgi:hypothetical protein